MPEEERRYLRPAEVAKILRQHPRTVERKMREGTLPGGKISGRWLCDAAALDRYLEEVTPAQASA